MIRVNNIIYIMAASYLNWRKINQFTGGNDEVVLLFQSTAKNVV